MLPARRVHPPIIMIRWLGLLMAIPARVEASGRSDGLIYALPEPATVILLGVGLLALSLIAWRRSRRK